MNFYTHILTLPYHEPMEAYPKLRHAGPSFLLESGVYSEQYGRFSLAGLLPALAVTLAPEYCTLELLKGNGSEMFSCVADAYRAYMQEETQSKLVLHIPHTGYTGDEDQRYGHLCPAQVLRTLMQRFQNPAKNFVGFYGAFAYNFAFQYEDYQPAPRLNREDFASDTPDARLYLFDTFILYNHLTESCQLYCTQATQAMAEAQAERVKEMLATSAPTPAPAPEISSIDITPTEAGYRGQVQKAIQLCEAGELLELVLSRQLQATFTGDALVLYDRYRKLNPSPYLFYFDFTDEVLLGASPEMMLRVEGGRAVMRPISGSVRRGANAVEEHHNMLHLLNSPKEKSELDMLIDLGRNDLARICEPGVRVDDYRNVEKYSHVMHTIGQVSGQQREGLPAFDALVATLPAGTLTGAPKPAALRYIDEMETHTRGYYGGAIGYMHLNNELNTGIIIRSAHIKNGTLRYTAGATLLVESDPQGELEETQIKTNGFMAVIEPFLQKEHATA